MNFKGNTHKGAALPLPPLPSCRSLATHVPCGANWELQSVEIFPKYISLHADKYMCMPGTHTHTHTHSCIFTCTFIYKHARAFAVSKQRHKRRRGRKRAGGRVGEAPQVKCSMRRGTEKRTEYRGKKSCCCCCCC